MKILAIETSCDETAISLIETKGKLSSPSFKVLANNLLSQVLIHTKYGGVFPNLAKREHEKALTPLLETTLQKADLLKKVKKPRKISSSVIKILDRERSLGDILIPFLGGIEIPKIDAVAVTAGPGLEPALWVGINFAKVLSKAWELPLYPVNHMEGHMIAACLEKTGTNDYKLTNLKSSAVALLISGGHTELIEIKKWGSYKLMGETRDDAAGEAFDKTARVLGLPYPGGPEISALAEKARKEKIVPEIKFPRPMINTPDYDFSFSGLKTSVLYASEKIGKLSDFQKKSFALEFENAVTETLLSKTLRAIKNKKAKILIMGGGVSANKHIRNEFKKTAKKNKFKLCVPVNKLSTDNALMIAATAYLHILQKKKPSYSFKASGNWQL